MVLIPSLPHRPVTLILVQVGGMFPAMLWVWRTSKSGEAPIGEVRSAGAAFTAILLIVFGCLAWLGYRIYPGALNPDEIAYRYESRILASGHVMAAPFPDALRASAIPPEVRFNHLVVTQRGVGVKYPPAWPLVLMIVSAGGRFEWIVNPILSSVLLFLVWKLAARMFDRTVALLSVALLAVCPWYFARVAGTMSHALAGCLIVGAMLFLETWLRKDNLVSFALGVALIGASLFVRPFTAMAAATAFGMIILWRLRRYSRRLGALVALVAVSAPVTGLYLLENKALTGAFFLSPYAATAAGTNSLREVTLDWHTILPTLPQKFKDSWFGTLAWSGSFAIVFSALSPFLRPRVPAAKAVFLSGIFIAEVLLLFLDVLPTGNRFGERMFFEGMPGIAILGAATAMGLVREWRVSRTALTATCAALACCQIVQCAAAFRVLQEDAAPSRSLISYLRAIPVAGAIVFMRCDNADENDWLIPTNLNINDPDWSHAKNFYLIDPGPDQRSRVTRLFNRQIAALVVHDAQSLATTWREIPSNLRKEDDH